MAIQTPQTTSLFRGWLFRIFLLIFGLAGFIGMAADTMHRLSVTTYGVFAEIAAASLRQPLPITWSEHDGSLKAPFTVRIQPKSGPEIVSELFLRRDVVEALLRGEKRNISYEQGNPRRYLLTGDQPPPFGFGWLLFGLVFSALFVFSLRLR
jgi:hypothetical protein